MASSHASTIAFAVSLPTILAPKAIIFALLCSFTRRAVTGSEHTAARTPFTLFAAVELKNEIKAYLEEKGHEVINIGTDTHDSCNYPEYGEKAGRMVAAGEADGGVLICGTGVGISFFSSTAAWSLPITSFIVLPSVFSFILGLSPVTDIIFIFTVYVRDNHFSL